MNKDYITVIMATYNGEKYILQQLESLHKQTRQPDEVIVLDDVSSDGTISMVRAFIEKNGLSNWRIVQNKQNKGWQRNFMEGFELAAGDIIFCSDQDDIWMANKIEMMADAMDQNKNILGLACGIEPLYEGNRSTPKPSSYQTEKYGNDLISKVCMDYCWLEPRRPGCTYCFRKSILPSLNALWFDGLAHDLLISAYCIASNGFYILNEPLVKYRRHPDTNTPSNKKTQEVRSGLLEGYYELATRFDEMGAQLEIDEHNLCVIQQLKEFFGVRKQAIENCRIGALLLLLKDIKMYPKLSSWGADVISSLNKS
jgi:glycosyltransferase involved in cell wall biosynthesis